MAARNVTWIDGITVSSQDIRLLATALGIPDAALSARSGVRPGGDLAVTANATPNMSVNVAAGQAFIDGTESFAQGLFLASNDSTVNLTIAAADATNPRRDLIVARVYSETVTLASRRFALEVVTGTAAPSPVDPAIPANSIVLAKVAVAAAASSITTGVITDLRAYTTALGGVVPCLSSTHPTGTYAGMVAYETDTAKFIYFDGSGWGPMQPGFIDEKTDVGGLTLSGTSAVEDTATRISIAAQGTARRYKITAKAVFSMASGTSGSFRTYAFANVNGAGAAATGLPGRVNITVTGGPGQTSSTTFATVLVPAGQTAVFSTGVRREAGGSTSDSAIEVYCLVEAC